jgi:hypothetical protein
MFNSLQFFKLALRYFSLAVSTNFLTRLLFRPKYIPIPFSVTLGGNILKEKSLKLPVLLTQTQDSVLNHPIYGNCSSCVTFVSCRSLKSRDLDDREIYEGSNGSIFVYVYSFPTETSVDKGYFNFPRLDVPSLTRTLQDTFIANAEEIVTNVGYFNPKDELEKLTLFNRIVNLQKNAFTQALNQLSLAREHTKIEN